MSVAEAIARLQDGAERLDEVIAELRGLRERAELANDAIQMAYNDATGNVISASINIRNGKGQILDAVAEFILASHSVKTAIARLQG
ncbi:MAG TPA: hypothetical protein VIY48_17520 [Candidatus Paceibacterota bacterium]